MSNDIITAIKDPYGYGFEGRVGGDHQFSERRKQIATALRQFSNHSFLAPVAVQYEYLLCYGYYTAEEMKDHPGRLKQILSKAELEKLRMEQELREAKQQNYLAELHKDQWEKRERRVRRWGQRRFELEQQQRQNSQHDDVASPHDDETSQHEDSLSQHYEVISQLDDTATQHNDAASHQDEPRNDSEDEPADDGFLDDRGQVSGWDTTEVLDIPSNIQGAFGRRHSAGPIRGGDGRGQGRGGDTIHIERPQTEGSSSTGVVYMSGALRGGYRRGRGNGQYGRGRGRVGRRGIDISDQRQTHSSSLW